MALPAAAAAQNAGGGDGQGDDRDGRRQGDNDRNRGGDGRDDDDDRNGRDRNDGGPDRFDRLFDLPSFAEPSESLREALVEIGRPGGILDAGDPLDVGPVRLITEPDLSPNNRDHLTQFAGFTFLGQFIDHDLTNDAGSRLGQVTPVRRSTNLRTARFDLDSVYGGGPAESPMLYDGFRFRVESGGLFEDLPRDDAGGAIIGDPRNDENLIISGLQAAFLLFHNAVLDGLSANPTEADFVQARQIVRWHYQWIVVNEVLPHYVGQDLIDEIVASGRQIFTPNQARIPVEFQTSVYRFGHSIIRPSYRANLAGDRGEPFFAFVFDPSTFGDDDPEDLSGGHRAPRRFIGWQTFFDFGDGEVKP
ncbi:MAG: peroxidase family protein, partial [Actinomycetota bacterium]